MDRVHDTSSHHGPAGHPGWPVHQRRWPEPAGRRTPGAERWRFLCAVALACDQPPDDRMDRPSGETQTLLPDISGWRCRNAHADW